MSTDNFKWTTELVSECVATLILGKGNIRSVQDFIESKSPSTNLSDGKDWEILTCFDNKIQEWKDGKDWHDYVSPESKLHFTNCDIDECKIRSVKRLSDNVVFSVGDKIGWGEVGNYETSVRGFNVKDGELFIGVTSCLRDVSFTKAVKLHKKLPTNPIPDTPVKEKTSIGCLKETKKHGVKEYWYEFVLIGEPITKENRSKVQSAIEAALNEDTVVDNPNKEYVPSDKEMILIKERRISELEQRIEFWKESNNENYESFKRVCYELRALKKQYGQISLPENQPKEQADNSKPFVWTNQLIFDCCVYLYNTRKEEGKSSLDMIEDFKKSKQSPPLTDDKDKPVLFTTEDGVEIRSGQTVCYVLPNFETKNWTPSGYDNKISEELKYFSTPEAAEQYILENKPFLSIKDIEIMANYKTNFRFELSKSELYHYAKEKLKQ